LLGFSKEIKHLDGHKVKLVKKKITKPGEVQRMEGEGMPIYEVPSDHGDLLVTYIVEFPKELSGE
jgi:DnaJ-related protein SCJ1